MSSLYELTNEMKEVMAMLYDDEVDTQTVLDTMEGIGMEIEDKADGYAKLIQQLTYDADARKKEAERLTQAAKALDDRATKLKEALKKSMEATGKTKFKTDLFSFSVRNNGGKIPLAIDKPVEEIPIEYLIARDPVVNTDAVRKALDENNELVAKFAHYKERGTHLQIK